MPVLLLPLIRKYGHQAFILGSSLTATTLYGYSHSGEPLKKFQNELQSDTDGKPDLIDMDILLTVEEIKQKLKWNSQMGRYSGDLLELFPSKTLDICSKGTMHSNWGSLIGVPVFYSRKFIERVEEDPTLLNEYNIDLSTEEGKTIFQMLKLNAYSKNFSLGKEMVQTKSAVMYLNAAGITITGLGCYASAVTLSSLLPFRGSILLTYLLTAPLMVFGYFRFFDFQNRWAEKRVIARVSKLDKEIAFGGVVYYNALIERDKLINENTSSQTIISDAPKNKSNSSIICDFILQFVNYINANQWFIEYRRPSLTNVEKKNEVLKVIKQNYPDIDHNNNPSSSVR